MFFKKGETTTFACFFLHSRGMWFPSVLLPDQLTVTDLTLALLRPRLAFSTGPQLRGCPHTTDKQHLSSGNCRSCPFHPDTRGLSPRVLAWSALV